MLDERRRIEESHGVVDNVLAQAYAVQEGFGVQREMLSGVQRRIRGAAGKVPGIDGLIGRIGAKRRRDGFIMVSSSRVSPFASLWHIHFISNAFPSNAELIGNSCVVVIRIKWTLLTSDIAVGRLHSLLLSDAILVYVNLSSSKCVMKGDTVRASRW